VILAAIGTFFVVTLAGCGRITEPELVGTWDAVSTGSWVNHGLKVSVDFQRDGSLKWSFSGPEGTLLAKPILAFYDKWKLSEGTLTMSGLEMIPMVSGSKRKEQGHSFSASLDSAKNVLTLKGRKGEYWDGQEGYMLDPGEWILKRRTGSQ